MTKNQKKEIPEPADDKAAEDVFKLKKKSSGPRRQLPLKQEEQQPAFAGMKLKKAETVKRTWEDKGLETVDLKHHEFEKEPLEELVFLTQPKVFSIKKLRRMTFSARIDL